jgi:periplasmic protein TonB
MRDRTLADRVGSGSVSVLVHGIVLAVIAGVFHWSPKVAPNRLPGTREGVRLLTYYSPGSTQPAQNEIAAKVVEKRKPVSITHSALSAPQPASATAPNADPGVGNSGLSGLGDGNITIALQKYFPYPRPSLAGLPHGTIGDVVLEAVIDEHGKIEELTLVKGLGPPIDDEVIQTVNQWTYSPAMKNGVPVRSEQELHFHYERSG